MKVALCYSGLVRTLNEIYDNHFENIYQHYDCDLYFHLWNNWGYGTVKEKYSPNNDELTIKDKEFLIKKFKPIDYVFENFKNKEGIFEALLKSNKQDFPYCKNVLSMHYKIMQCNNLIVNSNIKYDIVMRLRCDHFFTRNIELKIPDENTIYTSMLPSRTNGSDGVNDQIAYGDTLSMTKYSGLFNKWDTLYDNQSSCNPEITFKRYLTNLGIIIEDDANIDHWILNKHGNLR